MSKKAEINTKKAPEAVGPYSQGIDTDQFAFISGQLPVNPSEGKITAQNIQEQTTQVLDNLKFVLNEVNLDYTDVVRCDVFVKDMDDFAEVNKIYGSRFNADPKPARQTIQVGRLPLDALVEISCIALKKQ